MSDYKTRDDLIRENELLKAVIEQKNEIIRGWQVGVTAGAARINAAEEELIRLKQELKGAEE